MLCAGGPDRVARDRMGRQHFTPIAAVPGGWLRRKSWAKTRHAKWLEAHGEKIRRERNFCPSYLQPGFRDTEGVVRTGSG
jgi:hypothetical protein